MSGSQIAPPGLDHEVSAKDITDILAVLTGKRAMNITLTGTVVASGAVSLTGDLTLTEMGWTQHYDSGWVDWNTTGADWDTGCTFIPNLAQLWFRVNATSDSRQVYGIHRFIAIDGTGHVTTNAARGARIRYDYAAARVRVYFGASLTPDGAETSGQVRLFCWA